MSATFTLSGQARVTPDTSQSDTQLSGQPATLVPLTESLTLEWYETRNVEVTPPGEGGQSSYSVSVDDLHVLIVRPSTPVVLTFDGSPANRIPVDKMLVLVNTTTALTDFSISGYAVAGTVQLTMGRVA